MMDKKIVEVKTLKPGKYVLIEDIPCRISGMTHSKPGKHGGARVRIDGTGIFDGQKKSMILPASDKADVPIVKKSSAQVLTIIGETIQMMDMESYETFDMPMPKEDDIKALVKEGSDLMYMQIGAQRKITQAKGGD
ncbi:MAG: translation initiation factor IF-5A [Candidatus Altiarchaeota archaeon]